MIDPNQVVREVFELFRGTANREKIELVLELESRLGPMLFNAEDLHTILSNLVHNAIEACKFDVNRREHRIMLRSILKGPLAVFEVEDNGPGLPEEWENYLFTGMLSTKSRYGTGLGLLVTRKIVNELGGQITFSSTTPGEGSIFRVTFPLKTAPADQSSPATEASPVFTP